MAKASTEGNETNLKVIAVVRTAKAYKKSHVSRATGAPIKVNVSKVAFIVRMRIRSKVETENDACL